MYKDARETLPPALLDALMKIKQPFISAIYDFTAPAIVFGQIAMVGDAVQMLVRTWVSEWPRRERTRRLWQNICATMTTSTMR